MQLHALQELMDLFPVEEKDNASIISPSHQEGEQLFLTLSVATLEGSPAPRTMCLQGIIQGHEVTIFIESGSSHTFISENVASVLKGVVPGSSKLLVKVANGQRL
jgi:hypothetical protein